MAFLDFSDNQYIKFADTGEDIRMGGFSTVNNMELKHIRTTIYIDGAIPTTERMKIEIHGHIGVQSLLYTSDWANLADIANVSDRWLGWIRIDFNREPINKDVTYYPKIVLDNYTAIAGSFRIGFAYDFPFPVYDNSQDLFYNHPIAMQIFGYED
jgi:hypothetical protein